LQQLSGSFRPPAPPAAAAAERSAAKAGEACRKTALGKRSRKRAARATRSRGAHIGSSTAHGTARPKPRATMKGSEPRRGTKKWEICGIAAFYGW
jgi:hypothetical protein